MFLSLIKEISGSCSLLPFAITVSLKYICLNSSANEELFFIFNRSQNFMWQDCAQTDLYWISSRDLLKSAVSEKDSSIKLLI